VAEFLKGGAERTPPRSSGAIKKKIGRAATKQPEGSKKGHRKKAPGRADTKRGRKVAVRGLATKLQEKDRGQKLITQIRETKSPDYKSKNTDDYHEVFPELVSVDLKGCMEPGGTKKT